MKKQVNRILSLVLAMFMLISMLGGIVPAAHAASFSSVSGWFETIVAEISGVSDSQVTGVSYSGTSSGSLTGEDLEFLVRNTSSGVRIDIPGVKAGTYNLTVTTSSGSITASNISVAAYDRSGYAHWNNTEGVGAYNDDGTLKSNAIVLYVTDSNKNSVTVTSKDGTTVTGIGHILNSAGMDTGSGTCANGSSDTNNNKGILQKLASDGTPLVIRIVGNVTAPDGVTAYDSTSYGGSEGDNGYMARMKDAMNVTIEGIGNDACINGWGIHFMCTDAYPSFGKNFEVRNIAFKNVPEDCIGMEGVQSGSTLTASVERCWVHNCAFYAPSISNPADSDKDGGDGACDFKRGQYFTNSYCIYSGYHKTNLVGASDSNLQYNLTYHHNYYKNCESRAPLARTANIHIYNSVFENQSSYCMSLRADTYIFSEYNTFIASKVTDGKTNGVCKSYNNSFDSSCTKMDPLTIVSSKSTTVSSANKYANFDTNSSLSYIPSGDYILETASASYNTVMASAGPMTTGSATTPEGGTSSGGSTDPDATTAPTSSGSDSGSTTVPAGSYVHNFTQSGTSSSFYTITGSLSTSKGSTTYNGETLTQCLKMESSTTITFNAPESGTLTLVFGGTTSADGSTVKIDGVKQTISGETITVDVAAGDHTVTKGDSINLFYMVYTSDSVAGGETEATTAPTEAHSHSYTSSVTTAATCGAAGVMTYTCSCGDSYTEAIAVTGSHSYSNGVCTVCGAADPSYVAPTETTAPTEAGHTHSYSASVTAATCENAGYTTYTCSCGDSYTGSYVAATGHSYSNGYCTACGAADPNSGTVSGGSTTGGGTGTITEAGGRLESAYVEWTAVSGASGYNVYVRQISGSYEQLDSELIRNYGSYWRADAVGLSAGSYCMKIVPIINGSPNESSSMVTTALTVVAHDRSGYAHTNGSVGAYNNDGTLKSGAVVVYVTKDNVDSVKATIDGTTYTGLQSILYDSRKTSAVICVRIIGEIAIPSSNTSGQIQIKENASAITVEGIGEDATCNGWGISLSKATNVEVRNLGFMNNASSEGDSVTLDTCTYSWVHNCDFFYGTDRGGDKSKGDGALDTKKSEYITHSYNHFWDCGKCNLQGSNTSDTSDNITYHHNWYDHSDSRHPRVRVATVHVYNNYYDGVAKYGIGNAYKAEVISECNYFLNTKNPMLTSTQGSDTEETMSGEEPGTLTSYNDYVTGATSWIPNVDGIEGATSWSSTDYDCIIVDTTFSGYSYTLQSAADARTTVMEYAGRMNGGDFQWVFTDADNTDYERNTALDAALQSYSTSLVSVGGSSVTASTSNDGPASDDSSHTHTYVSSTTTSATCTTAGVITYTCDCGASYTSSIAALGHNYVNGVCTRCGAEESTSGGETGGGSGTTVPAGSYVHNFTENGTSSSFYTITGNLSTGKGSTTYNGETLTQCLKMESSTTITFNAPADGTLTLVFGGTTSADGSTVKIDGEKQTISGETITVDVTAGDHTVTKGDTINLFYMVYTSNSTGEAHSHSYTASVTTAATCTTAGVRTYTCSCGDSYTEAITALGHSYSSAVTAPTCTEQGYTTHTCSACGDSYADTYVAANGHSYVDGTCSVCGEADPNYVAPTEPVHSHSYTAAVTAPSCTEQGYTTYTCACGDSYVSDYTAATGHSYSNGTCSVCGEADPNYSSGGETTTSEYVHNFTENGTSSSFYTITGNLSTSKGSTTYNGETLTQCLKMETSTTITFNAPADGTLTLVFGGTTSADGKSVKIDGEKQTISGETITVDVAAGDHTVTKGESINLFYMVYAYTTAGGDTHTHSYAPVVTAPTCTEQGYTTYTCSCGDSYVSDYAAATGHSYSSSVVAPTCTEAGTRTYTCPACGDTYSETIEATGHSYAPVVTAPTCTEQGYTTYTCSCGDSYVSDYAAATGHSYDSNGICINCGEEDPNATPPLFLFTISGTSMSVGNDLSIYFFVKQSDVADGNYYMQITKTYADGREDVVRTVPFDEWVVYGDYYRAQFSGIAAKEMGDSIMATVYTTDGVAASYTKVTSIVEYATSMLNDTSDTSVACHTLLADMLNYGAAAQTFFGYDTDHLVNEAMTAANKACASQSFDMTSLTSCESLGTGCVGTTLSLKSNILLTFFFDPSVVTSDMTAKVSYTNHYGRAISYEITGSGFTTYGGYLCVDVNTLVASDVSEPVTVEIYDGNTLISTSVSSMESYCQANYQTYPFLENLMMFCTSAHNYFHP